MGFSYDDTFKIFTFLCLVNLSLAATRTLKSDPGVSLVSIESAGGVLPSQKPDNFTYEPVDPEFYKQVNDPSYHRFNATYYETLNDTSVGESYTAPPRPNDLTAEAVSDGYDYQQLLSLSLLFYDSQRSGKLPANFRVKWRGDSAVSDVSPGGTDVSGGFYDAGDNLKLNFPAAFTAGNLAWSYLEFPESYKNSGNDEYIIDIIRWFADYFIKCHYAEDRFVSQVGDLNYDHNLWQRPEDMNDYRPSFEISPSNPGSDLLGQVVGFLAASSIIFQPTDTQYSAKLLNHALSLYCLATKYEGKYSDHLNTVVAYPSTSYLDDLAWATIWMYRATGQLQLLQNAEAYVTRNTNEEGGGYYQAYGWDGCSWGVYAILSQWSPNGYNYSVKLRGFSDAWFYGSSAVAYSPGGLAVLNPWGSLRYSSNAAWIMLVWAKVIKASDWWNASRFECWARNQIRYMLGDSGRSYVVGYGSDPPTHAHHRAASCPTITEGYHPPCDYSNYALTSPNPNTIYGALVGGPGADDAYADYRSDYQKNEVALDYNAGFTASLAALVNSQDNIWNCVNAGFVKPINPVWNNRN